jgi:hypothetical protein
MKRILSLMVTLACLSACGSGGGSGAANNANPGNGNAATTVDGNATKNLKVARLSITPGAVLFTQARETQTFTAQAFDQSNTPMSATPTWSSSNPSVVVITTDGQAQAQGKLGSATITAKVGDVTAVTIAVMASVAPDTLVVKDSDVVSVTTAANESFKVGSQYQLTLKGNSAPKVGAILVPRETAAVGGRVVTVNAGSNQTTLTVEVIPLPDLFTKLELDEVVKLAQVTPNISERAKDYFDITELGAGRYSFIQKAGKVIKSNPSTLRPKSAPSKKGPLDIAEQTFELGPFDCASKQGVIAISLDLAESTPDLSTMDFQFKWSDAEKKILLTGAPTLAVKFKPRLATSFSGEVTCKVQFFEFPIPFPGVLALIGQMSFPIGAGFSLAGEMPISQVGVDIEKTVLSN